MIEAGIHGLASAFFIYMAFSVYKVSKYVRNPEVTEAESPPYPKVFIPFLKFTTPVFVVVFAFMFLVNLGQCIQFIVRGL